MVVIENLGISGTIYTFSPQTLKFLNPSQLLARSLIAPHYLTDNILIYVRLTVALKGAIFSVLYFIVGDVKELNGGTA